MKTKHTENRYTTSDLSKMKGKYLAQRLVRKWAEDFVDEDTGNVVSVERSELIMDRATLLDPDKLVTINFHLQSGDIAEVEVSDIPRQAYRIFQHTMAWMTTVLLNNKPKNLYLYADNLEQAIEITVDFVEQTQTGSFSFKQVKRLGYTNLLSDDLLHDNESDETKEIKTYKIEVEQKENEDGYIFKSEYIIKATDVENAKKTIEEFITKSKIKAQQKPDFEITVLTAKTIRCDHIIGIDFYNEYKKYDNE